MIPAVNERQSKHPLRPWFIWVACVLLGWITLVSSLGIWQMIADRWAIALTMLFGSYVAGSTPLGGGTVGFPILVFLFGEPASLGREFSFAIQSIGMTSSSILILCTRHRLANRTLAWAIAGSFVSLPPAVIAAAQLNDAVIKLVFACVWAGFGVMTLWRISELLHLDQPSRITPRLDSALGFGAGIFGGVVAGLSGTGVDMAIFTVLVLVHRCELRIAIATSVILMATNSLLGTAVEASLGHLDRELLYNWAAAVPIVLFGGPLGALAMRVIPRRITMVLVALLCLAQLVWAIVNLGASGTTVTIAVVAVAMLVVVFHFLHRWGDRLEATASALEG